MFVNLNLVIQVGLFARICLRFNSRSSHPPRKQSVFGRLSINLVDLVQISGDTLRCFGSKSQVFRVV